METEILFQRPGARPSEASVVFLAYNQAGLVGEAASSVLAQEGVSLEIVFSDDASSDRTPQRLLQVAQAYNGPHAVVVRRNRRRLGMNHLVSVVESASTEYHLMAHGDDRMRPGRCARTMETFRSTGAAVVSVNAQACEEPSGKTYPYTADRENGILSAEEIARAGWLRPMLGATLAWRREVYSAFPRLDTELLPSGHDHLVPFRGALMGGMYFLNELLIDYRVHAGQWSQEMYGAPDWRMREEYHAGRSLSAQLAMVRDLEHFRAAHPEATSRLDEIERVLREACWQRLQEWMAVRDSLAREGLGAHWLSPAALRRAREARRWEQRLARLTGR